MEIADIWNIVKEGGALGILFLTNAILWIKLDKKDKMIYDILPIIKETTNNQAHIIDRLKEMNDVLLKIFTK